MMNKLTSEGHTVIFISHKLNEIMKSDDRCTVLRQGKLQLRWRSLKYITDRNWQISW